MSTRRVLVVEDDPAVRDAVAGALEDAGVHVTLAGDGLAALELLRAGAVSPDLILLDLWMPRLDGEGFLAELRADRRFEHVAVVTMTAGDAFGGDEIAARLRKPFDLGALVELVVAVCDDLAAA